MPLSAHPKPEGLFEHLMMDFIELTLCRVYKYCLINVKTFFLNGLNSLHVNIPQRSKIAKSLFREIIPHRGLPKKLTSDNGSHCK